MSRNNRLIDLVFSNINKRKQQNPVDVFLDTDKALSLPVDPLLERYKKLYRETVAKINDDLELLASLEEAIVQIRCQKYAPKDFNLSITNNSIYVKLLFYRNDRKIKDIRIIAGPTTIYGTDLKALAKDQFFIDMFTEKAYATMQKEIIKSIDKLENKIKNVYIYM